MLNFEGHLNLQSYTVRASKGEDIVDPVAFFGDHSLLMEPHSENMTHFSHSDFGMQVSSRSQECNTV